MPRKRIRALKEATLTGKANALTRGQGKKVGLRRGRPSIPGKQTSDISRGLVGVPGGAPRSTAGMKQADGGYRSPGASAKPGTGAITRGTIGKAVTKTGSGAAAGLFTRGTRGTPASHTAKGGTGGVVGSGAQEKRPGHQTTYGGQKKRKRLV